MVPFNAKVELRPDGPVVSVDGELDMLRVSYLGKLLEDLLAEDHPKLVLDLSGATFIDSRGLAAVLAAHRSWTDRGRAVEIVRGPPHVMRIFEISVDRDAPG
jgi:anti-sigma B factor antagonist